MFNVQSCNKSFVENAFKSLFCNFVFAEEFVSIMTQNGNFAETMDVTLCEIMCLGNAERAGCQQRGDGCCEEIESLCKWRDLFQLQYWGDRAVMPRSFT